MFQPLSTLPLSKKLIDNFTSEGFLFVSDINNDSEIGVDKLVDTDIIKDISRLPITLLALDHWQVELQYQRCTTFSEVLNAILDGGIQCGMITEICGPPGSGKTQLCFQISIAVQLSPNSGGLSGSSLYIETRNAFSSQRIRDLITECQNLYPHMNLDRKVMEENIIVILSGTYQEFLLLIKKLKSYMLSSLSHSPIRVIIIDSLAHLFTPINNSSQKTTYYIEILDELQKLASKFNIAIIIVNELVTQVNNNNEIYFESAGGQITASRCSKSLMLVRISNSKFAARILKSPTMSQVSVLFNITRGGIQDE